MLALVERPPAALLACSCRADNSWGCVYVYAAARTTAEYVVVVVVVVLLVMVVVEERSGSEFSVW